MAKCDAGATCGAFSPSSAGLCPTVITAHGGACKAHATPANACIDDVCSAYNANATDCKAKKVAYTTPFQGSATA